MQPKCSQRGLSHVLAGSDRRIRDREPPECALVGGGLLALGDISRFYSALLRLLQAFPSASSQESYEQPVTQATVGNHWWRHCGANCSGCGSLLPLQRDSLNEPGSNAWTVAVLAEIFSLPLSFWVAGQPVAGWAGGAVVLFVL